MVRTEISLFLKNAPGELGRLAAMLGEAGINIDALTIQDASNYVRELFQAGENRSNGLPRPPATIRCARIRSTSP